MASWSGKMPDQLATLQTLHSFFLKYTWTCFSLSKRKKNIFFITHFLGGGGEFTKGDSGEKPESVSRVSEKNVNKPSSEFQKKKFS